MGKTVGLVFAETQELNDRAEVFTCPHCGKEYKSAKTLEAHCKKEHPEMFDE